jgi:transposase
MSTMSIAPYFPFPRVRIVEQWVGLEAEQAFIEVVPDKRFRPLCHRCGSRAIGVHSQHQRWVRDLNFASARVSIRCHYRKIACPQCRKILIEELDLFDPYLRVTKRLAFYIYQLCQMMTVKEVAEHLGLDWKTVKAIDRRFLEQDYGQTDYKELCILAVDEISICKGHRYLTVVLDYETGRVVWVGKERKARTLKQFFNGMTKKQRKALEAIAMDMWDPYIRAVREKVPHVAIVFDLFHVVSKFNRVIDKVRNSEYRKACKAHKSVIKGTKYLLLSNRPKIRRLKDREHLAQLLKLNKPINLVHILKDKLKHIWSYKSRAWANKAIDQWCALARAVGHPAVTKFAKTLERYRYGILNHCDYSIHTCKLEGVNNKIKVIKRRAYGYHDTRYFSLKIIQAFSN